MKTKRIIALIMVALMSMFVLAGCGGSNNGSSNTQGSGTPASSSDGDTAGAAKLGDLDKVTAAGKMVIGITDYQPMNFYEADGTLTGFDTEYAQAVAAELGIEAEFIEIDWDNKEIELNAGIIDAIWNGMTYTVARDENMDFSKPYIINEIVVVIRTADADKYKTVEDVATAKIVAEGGSTAEDIVMGDDHLKDSNFTPVDSLVISLMEVAAGTADVSVVDSVMAKELVGQGAYADLMIVEDINLADELLAIGFRTGSDLPAEIDRITADLYAAGTLQALADKYGVHLASF